MQKFFHLTTAAFMTLSLNALADGNAAPAAGTVAQPVKTINTPVTALIKTDDKIGEGKLAVGGQKVTVHYTGWLFDPKAPMNKGTKFDSSVDRGEPFKFLLGAGEVIRGWDEGVAGMKVGGKRTLIIPSYMGYGTRGAGGVIPPNATLMFAVELLDVK